MLNIYLLHCSKNRILLPLASYPIQGEVINPDCSSHQKINSQKGQNTKHRFLSFFFLPLKMATYSIPEKGLSKFLNPLRNPADCRHKMQASPPRAWSNWWRARRDHGQNGGEPAAGAVTYVDIPPANLPLQNKRLASPPRARSKMQATCRTGGIADWSHREL